MSSDYSKHSKASVFYRLVALEARATKRANLGLQLYLPVIFITYGILLGKLSLHVHVCHGATCIIIVSASTLVVTSYLTSINRTLCDNKNVSHVC